MNTSLNLQNNPVFFHCLVTFWLAKSVRTAKASNTNDNVEEPTRLNDFDI